MNLENWTVESGKQWAANVTMLRKFGRQTKGYRKGYRRIYGCLAVVYIWLAAYQAGGQGHYWSALVNTGVGWMMYRMYRSNRKREPLWVEAAHHAQRMLVETRERALWHSDALGAVLDNLKKS